MGSRQRIIRYWFHREIVTAIVALNLGCVRTARSDEPAAGHTLTETETRQTIDVTIGPRELMRQRDKMPFVMDTSLATLRRDNETWFFYHSVDWGNSTLRNTAAPQRTPSKRRCGTRVGTSCTI